MFARAHSCTKLSMSPLALSTLPLLCKALHKKGYVKNFIMLRNLSEWLFETAQRRIRAVFLYIILELERDLTKSITDLSVSQTASSLGI